MHKLCLTLCSLLLLAKGLKVSQGVECGSIRGYDTSSFLASPSDLCDPYTVSWSGRFTDNYCTSDYSVKETFNSSSSYTSLIRQGSCYNANTITTLSFLVYPFRCLPGTYDIEINVNELDEDKLDKSIACRRFSYSIS